MKGLEVKYLIKEKGMTQQDIAEKLRISRVHLGRILADSADVDPFYVNKIFSVLGVDNLKNVSNETSEIVSEPDTPYHTARLQRKNTKEWPGIPVWEASPITATNTEVYHDEKIGNPDFYLNVPQLRDCNYAGRARGDSMHPKISNGDIVIGKEMTDLSVIMFGEIYIIHTRNGIETVKYIHPVPGEEEKILLVPANEKAKSTPIMKSDILRLFEYRAVFKI